MKRVYNFSPGPAALPLPVLERAKKEMTDFEGTGMCVMEMSHRSKVYEEIVTETESLLRDVMNIPKNYKVLSLQGGASLQFYMIPLNLMRNSKRADYVNTGMWSARAIEECRKFWDVSVAASSEESGFREIPNLDSSKFDENADYFHITSNNTVYGTKFCKIPETKLVPLVSDMSSYILSEPVNVGDYGIIYAGAQKNIGPAGVTVVIIRDDLICDDINIPAMLSYRTHADSGSLYNTPSTYGIYIINLVLKWLKSLGGVEEISKINDEKARVIYDFLDNSKIFTPYIKSPHRSKMNVTYSLPNNELNDKFVKESEKNGFLNLKGYRTLGGIRASIYNAVPLEAVVALVDFMKKFEVENV